jgi:hypothetical protein
LEQAVRREVLQRIAQGVPDYRLPKGTTFETACKKLKQLGKISDKALSKLRRERLGASDFPMQHPEVKRIQCFLELW